jgi:hypothetical protein
MKLPIIVLLMAFSIVASAQSPEGKVNALGIYGESNGMFSGVGNPVMNTVGLQYNKWNKRHMGFVVTLGYGSYVQEPSIANNFLIGSDTLRGKIAKSHFDMGIVGFGIQAERQFYKKIYFFAGFQVRAGYGSGQVDTTITHQYNVPQVDPVTGITYQNMVMTAYGKTGSAASTFYVGLTPSVGAKLNFKKFCIGTEFMNYITYRSQTAAGRTDGLIDFDIANITQRIFVQCRF